LLRRVSGVFLVISLYSTGKSYLVPAYLYDDYVEHINIGGYSEENIKAYISRHIDEGPAFASDHQPIVTFFEF